MSKEEINNFFDIILQMVFEAGCWVGQVELEEHYDNEQYSTVVFEAIKSKKISIPLFKESTNKTVIVELRSDKWRNGVRKNANLYIEKAKFYLIKYINK